ncbi:unnamed protein product [Rotaria magnacalcarata]|uniref:FAD-binding FR-type domain-containing protein n=1 Tax=Rotaria magnacalcarata TaxID=392030 RepID=A0A815RRY2_9BILA|nr:unnamed protein product [Rotaria magnacalcarata]CAF1481610.1 unnamed protein product [Rotaria magnacalcarata]CAF3913373.1 unnamed protein product [Rotaria magnacalcarata]CAF4022710.1 unnamed protein product [Rotaria magnacalcarata]
MSASPSTSHAVLVMPDLQLEPTPSSEITTISPHNAKTKSMGRKKCLFKSIVRVPSSIIDNSVDYVRQRSMTRRQIAEIQLEAILNEPSMAVPLYFRSSRSIHRDAKILTIEEISKQVNAQSYMIEKLLHTLKISPQGGNAPALTNNDVQKLNRVLNSTIDVRVLLFFKMICGNDNDDVNAEQLTQFFEEYFNRTSIFNQDKLQEVLRIVRQQFHLVEKSHIDFDEFYQIVSQDPKLLESLSRMNIDPNWFISGPVQPPVSKFTQRCSDIFCNLKKSGEESQRKLSKDYIRDNLSRIIIWILYILANISLVIWVCIYRAYQQQLHVSLVLARIGGILLDFNSALMVTLMLKRTILILRSIEFIRKIIPLDDHIDFHKIIGRFIALLIILHASGHVAHFALLVHSNLEPHYTWAEYMFTTRPGIGWVGSFASISGIIIFMTFIIMFIFSLQWIRRGGHFEIFYWTHRLYWVYYVFLIIHAPNCWRFHIGPLTIFVCEKIYCIVTRYSSSSGRTYIKSATIEQSNVISLKIHRPKYLRFRPGDYIEINLPKIALYEFHPFTISSAPEETDFITVHIHATGNWTKRVYEHFRVMSEKDQNENHIKIYRADLNPTRAIVEPVQDSDNQSTDTTENSTDDDDEINNPSSSKRSQRETVLIRGPYSSCARYIFNCKHVVLIGGGIGITPYASILSSLMAQFRASRTICKRCNCVNYNSKSLVENRHLQKVDFIWVNRNQKNFEWFLNLLRQFEEEQKAYLDSNPEEKRFLDIHLFFTEIKNDENIENLPLDLVRNIYTQRVGQDIFTSLQTKTQIGRPNWNNLFRGLISGENASIPSDVNVFFCGLSTMGDVVHEHCNTFKFNFFKEEF